MLKTFRFFAMLSTVPLLSISAQAPPAWTSMNGTTTDIAVNPGGTLWALASGAQGTGDRPVLLWNGSTFSPQTVSGVRIAVEPAGTAWVVAQSGLLRHQTITVTAARSPDPDIRRSSRTIQWIATSLKARDVAVGANGAVWAIGQDQATYHLVNGGWVSVGGGALKIAVDPSGNPWVINGGGEIWHWTPAGWQKMQGSAREIAVAPNGTLYIIGTITAPGGYQVLKGNGSTWTPLPNVGAIALAAGTSSLYLSQDATAGSRTLASAYTSPAFGATVTPLPTTTFGTAISITSPTIINQPSSTSSGTSGTLVIGGNSPVVTSSAPLVVTGLAPAAAASVPGSLVCPIIVAGPRLQLGCALMGAPAVFIATAPSATCASGSFYDPRNNGECWSCPDGFMRYTTPVNGSDACWKAIGENVSSATKTGKFGCQVGYFGDPRNGGECWQCPSGYYRTLDAVTWSTACAQAILGPFSFATKGAGPVTSCGSGFSDPIDGGTCWTCPDGYRRTLYAVTATNACAQTVGTQYVSATQKAGCSMLPSRISYGTPFRDPQNGGECWACPIPLQRSASPVNATAPSGMFAACVVGGDTNMLVWKLPQYPEPGAYRFMEGLLPKALANPQTVDAFLSRQAGGNAVKKRALWTAMIADPAGSAELKALMLAALVTTATEANPDPTAVASMHLFEQYAHDRRVFVAAEATRMYNAWQGIDGYNTYEAARRSSGLGGLSSAVIGDAGGDYRSYAWSAAVPDSDGVAAIVSTASLSGLESGPLGTTLNSGVGHFSLEYFLPLTESLSHSLDAIMEAGGDMIVDASTLSELGQGALVLKGAGAAFVGLQLMSAGIEVAKGITALIEKDKAAAEYAEFATRAAEPFSVREVAESTKPEDRQTLLLFWALATSPYAAGNTLGTGRISGAALCTKDGWTSAQCARAKSMVTAAAKAAGY